MIPARSFRCHVIAGLVAVLVWALFAPAARAQEVITSDYHWHYELGENATLPAWRKFPVIKYPASFLKAPDIRYVIVLQHIGVRGEQSTRTVMGGGVVAARESLIKASREMRLKTPARRDGLPTEADVWFAVIFNPPPAATAGDAPARLLQVGPAPIPFVRGKDRLPRAAVRLVITPEGRMELGAVEGDMLTDAQRHAVEDGVAHWKFSPAQQGGLPVFSEVMLPVAFLPIESPEERDYLPPRLIKSVRSDISTWMKLKRPQGEVRVQFAVDETGALHGATVVRSTNPDLNDAVLAAVRQWQYQPATRHGKPVRATLTVPIRVGDAPPETKPGLVDEDDPGREQAPPFDIAPRLKRPLQLFYPRDLAAKGEVGRARVSITIGPDGRVRESHVERATALEFGRALQAALNAAEFTPATRGADGHAVQATLHVNREFDLAAAPGGAVVTLAVADRARLAVEANLPSSAAERMEGFTLHPEMTPALKRFLKTGGWAEVECWVERDGSTRLPRLTSYSQEILGYAALQELGGRRVEMPSTPGYRRLRIEFAPVVPAATPPK